jgi:CRISPR/Cas system endoribonuclease Cas6 (RAMP superfamily)
LDYLFLLGSSSGTGSKTKFGLGVITLEEGASWFEFSLSN